MIHQRILTNVRHFIVRYPAILASYFIVGYFFISTMHFYADFKRQHLSASDALQHFDTLLWMWAMAFALVKSVVLREQIFEKEKENLDHQLILRTKQLQIETLHSTIMTLTSEITEPLIMMNATTTDLKSSLNHSGALQKIENIETGTQRIQATLKYLSETKIYEVSKSVMGNLITIPSPPPQH